MSDVNLDLVALYKRMTTKPAPKFHVAPVSGDVAGARVEKAGLGSSYYATDPVTGIEYFMPVTVKFPDSSTTNAPDGLEGASTGLLTTWQLPFPIISMDMRKVVIETPLTERNGSVKELIQTKDYDITIKGFIVSATDDYPEADVMRMRDLFEVGQSISIRSALTDIFLLRPNRNGSDQVVILDLSFPGVKGVQNIEYYELKLVSDEPFNLIDIS